MTHKRDFDRMTRAWLDLMPNEAPDRVIANVLQAVETTPQVRRPLDVLRRFPPMNRITLAAVAVAAVVVAVIGGSMLLQTPDRIGATGSPSATASAAPSSAPPTVGAEGSRAGFTGNWLGGHRPIPGTADGAGMLLQIAGSALAVSQSNIQNTKYLSSGISTIGPGQVRLETTIGTTACSVGDIGIYDVSLSASGETATIVARSDTCGARADAVAGTWWRADCKAQNGTCLGLLDAGSYGSQYLDPTDPPGTWSPSYGRFTYTVPDGWANTADWPSEFGFTTAADYARPIDRGRDGGPSSIVILAQPAPAVQDGTCEASGDRASGRSVADLAAFISGLPTLDVAAGPAVTVDGHRGTVLDIALKPGAGACPDPASSDVQFLAGIGVDGEALDIAGTENERLILLDLGAGAVSVIAIIAPDPSQLDQVVAETMPIIQSFRFR